MELQLNEYFCKYVAEAKESPFLTPVTNSEDHPDDFDYYEDYEENKMYDLTPKTLAETQIDHFTERLSTIQDHAYTALEEKFGMRNSPRPETAQELVDTIKSGKFILNNETKDKYHYTWTDLMHAITWRDPKIEKDAEGFKKATDKLAAVWNTARDAIYSDPSKGAEVVAEFKKTVH